MTTGHNSKVRKRSQPARDGDGRRPCPVSINEGMPARRWLPCARVAGRTPKITRALGWHRVYFARWGPSTLDRLGLHLLLFRSSNLEILEPLFGSACTQCRKIEQRHWGWK